MSKKSTYILGLNVYADDVSACLLRGGEVAVAISKERITRKKHDSGFYKDVVDYCLAAEGISMNDVDLVVRNCYILPVEELETRLLHQNLPFFLDAKDRTTAAKDPLYRQNSNKVVTVSHHLAHAYSAFAVSPFSDGVVMVLDGMGSYRTDVSETYPPADNASALARESESYYRFDGSKIEAIKKIFIESTRPIDFYGMQGVGALYSRVSTYVFGHWNHCGEVMGLAPYGRPESIKPMIELKNGVLCIRDWSDDFQQPWLKDTEQQWEDSPAMQHWKDLAWRIQHDTEEVLLDRAIWLRQTTGAKNLCIAGGVALNCVANGRIVREAGFDNVWIQPAAGDEGIALGCGYYGHLAIQKNRRSLPMNHAYFGMAYKDEDINEAMDKYLVRLQTSGRRSGDICRDTARILSKGHVVGWFQGRSEFGPRALGNRSILADPRKAEMKDNLNKRVKHRQEFRPFAPCVLAERAKDIFESDEESPFMLLAKRVLPEWRERIPAVIHVDGTARVQTVRPENNERLYGLLKEFDAITGVPVLLNTSFNVRGEPIVETPRDAVECFLSTGIEYIALHDQLIAKRALHKVLSPIIRGYFDGDYLFRAGLRWFRRGRRR